jgi:hypothetical protein
MPESKHPLKVFLCHVHADRDPVRALYARLTKDGVDAWLDKAKLHGERSRTILPGQGFDRLNLADWELEIRNVMLPNYFTLLYNGDSYCLIYA